MSKDMVYFYKRLILWYLENKRDLPWRKTRNPYLIWLSEVILQQTRVSQGLPYYLKFVEKYPSVHDLASAPLDDVLKLWQGLGYYSRARNLHKTAIYISNELDGIFPRHYKDLLQLKGVGDYTASAIASICYDEVTAVVDGNVNRVLSRVFGLKTPINSSIGIKSFKALAQQLIDSEQPGTYNQAIMEFGARYCIPHKPDCSRCIFNDKCEALKQNQVALLPIKLKKATVQRKYFNYLVFLSEDGKTILQQRTGKGIWQLLYEFPLIETSEEVDLDQLQNHEEYKSLTKKFDIQSISLFNKASIIHKLSHRHLYTRFWIVESSELREDGIPIPQAQDYAVPVLVGNLISEISLFKT
jgi:A/G-specific adenine glycosylase